MRSPSSGLPPWLGVPRNIRSIPIDSCEHGATLDQVGLTAILSHIVQR